MPKFTVAELAKKYGIARTSIYDRMKNGSISYEIDAKNRKVIDFSEMQRVYGTPNSQADSKPDSKENDNTTVELYKQLIEELRHDKSVAEERERRMYKEIEQLKDKIDNLTLALGYTPKNIQPDSKPDSTNEQVRTTTDLQETVQPSQVMPIEDKPIQQTTTAMPQPKKRGLFGRVLNAVFDND
ncbi:plasmid replication DNA-binding protein [Acinetobacter baumannii]|uniref:plasmid replication DNA-binding protein n=1 Tax=Acinetobacter baumannii TaxID=470 RepID=UPI0025A15B4B|nr:plasmid replication DNA-binding protein [Acinetobacter baumannii]WPQ50861.1 plasmid replication DNA-binding protein [Acinetobacter baumannii]